MTARAAVATATLAGLALRLARIARAPLVHPDGPAYLQLARAALDGRWATVLGGYYSPLYPIAIAPFVAAGVEPELAGRLVAALAGAATIPLVASVTRRLLDEDAGVIAAALAALAPALVKSGADVLPETLAGLCLLAAVERLLAAETAAGFALAGGLAGATYLARPEGALAVVVGAFITARRRPRALAAFLVSALAVGSPAVLALHARTGGWQLSPRDSVLAARVSPDAGSLAGAALRHPAATVRLWAGGALQQVWNTLVALGPVFALPFAVGLARGRDATVLIAAAFTLGPLALNPSPRYAATVLPLLLPATADGVRRVGRSLGRRHVAVVALAGVILVVQGLWKSKSFDEACAREMRALLLERYGPGQTVVAVDGRFAASAQGLPVVPKTTRPDDALALMRARGARLWITRPQWLRDGFTPPPDVRAVARPCSGVFVLFEAIPADESGAPAS